MSVRVHVALMSAFLGLCWGVLAGALTEWKTPAYSLLVSPLIGLIAGELTRRYRLYEGLGVIPAALGLLFLTTGLYAVGWAMPTNLPHQLSELVGGVIIILMGVVMWSWFLWPLAVLSTYLIGWTIRQVTE